MGRPVKNNADYFPHLTTMRNHRKVKVLRNKFGSVLGYAFWCMMLEWLTEKDGLEWEYSDVECEMLAAELGVSATEIRDMVDFCIKLEMLFKTDSGFIYSESLNDNLKGVFEKRQTERAKSKTRKRREDGTFATNNAANGGVSATEKPHSKVKNSKVKKSKVVLSASDVYEAKVKEEYETLADDKKELWDSFVKFYYKDATLDPVRKLEQQPTPLQIGELESVYGVDAIVETLQEMANWKKISTKISVYLTLKNWLKRNND